MANDPLASVALDRLFEITVRLGDAMQRDVVGRGLTRARATVLWELHRVGPVTQRALSDAMRVTPRNVTGLVDGLETEGLVARRPHPTDRRAILVDLTQHGNEVITLLTDAYQQFTGFLFDEMPSWSPTSTPASISSASTSSGSQVAGAGSSSSPIRPSQSWRR